MRQCAVRALFSGLVDDAGLFPPAELAMTEALRRHEEDAQRSSYVLSGRFLCPSGRLPGLKAALDATELEAPLGLVLVGPLDPGVFRPAVDAARSDGRISLEGLEGPLPSAGPAGLDELPPDLQCSVEVPVAGAGAVRQMIEGIARTPHRAKVRCGGLRAELFPSVGELAGFVVGCAEAGVAFKATAGLHNAARHVEGATGFEHHGFLNLLLASVEAAGGASRTDLEAVLAVTDPGTLASAARDLGESEATAGRRLFSGYGSCSTTEPLDDLAALGLLEER